MSKRNRRNQSAAAPEAAEQEPAVETQNTEETAATSAPAEEPAAPEDKPVAATTEPKKVEKPVTNKVVVKMEAKQNTANVAPKAADPAVTKFNDLADKYIKLMSVPVITDDVRKQAIITLANLSNAVLMTNNVAVFDACYKFMLKNRNIMLAPETVVDGINKFLPKDKITRVVQFYVTFQALVESRIMNTKFVLNVTTIRRIFNNGALANWLLAKR